MNSIVKVVRIYFFVNKKNWQNTGKYICRFCDHVSIKTGAYE
jgi:hypothetical protein